MPTHPLPRISAELLDRYFTGACTPDEAVQVQAALAQNEQLAALQRGIKGDPVDVSSSWARFTRSGRMPESSRLRRILPSPRGTEAAGMAGKVTVTKLFRVWPRRDPGQHSLFRTVGFGVAAGAVFLAAGLTWLATHRYRPDRHPSTIGSVPAREVVTKRGERATFDLADGTRIVLAPASRLRIPTTYASGTGLGARDLELDGEAYFQVKHDTARPFRVRTAVGIAEDLGTEFVVTAYPETRGMRVLVASGEVGIRLAPMTAPAHDTRRSPPLALLQSGDQVQLDSLGAINIRHGLNIRSQLGWMSGRLVFDNTPLPEVIAVLQRWYDVEFRLNDPTLAALRVTTTFSRTSTDDVVEAFELVLKVRSERQGRVVTLLAPRGPSTHSVVVPPQGGTGIR